MSLPPSARATTAAKMVLGFKDDGGDLKHKTFFHQPLGLDFERQMPIVIKDVYKNSYADALGIKEGWTVVDVDWKNIQCKTYEDAWQLLCDASAPLPRRNCVVISFLTSQGARQEKTFFHGPLGIDFVPDESPLTVSEVFSGCYAQSVGVQPGWQVISLNGGSIANMEFTEALPMVQAAESTLGDVVKLDVEFALPDGSHKEFTFHTRPLGCEIEKTVPITIKTVHPEANAAKVGVQVGWVVRCINGEDVTRREFKEIVNMLRKAECIVPPQDDEEDEPPPPRFLQPDMPHKAPAPLPPSAVPLRVKPRRQPHVCAFVFARD